MEVSWLICVLLLWLTYFLIGCWVYRNDFPDSWYTKNIEDAINQGVEKEEAWRIVALYSNIQKYKWPLKIIRSIRK